MTGPSLVGLLAAAALAAAAAGGAGASKAVTVPVSEAGAWQDLHFRRIPPNAVSFSPAGLRVSVDRSASPLIHPLPRPFKVARVRARLKLSGSLAPGAGGWEEDSQFRLGLVESGDRRLDPFAKALAPAWVKKLYSLAPEGGGVSRIVFLMLGRAPAKVGDRRTHPSSELLEERIAWLGDGKPGERVLEAVLEPPVDTVALWVSVDGDATGSKYEVLLQSLELEPAGEVR